MGDPQRERMAQPGFQGVDPNLFDDPRKRDLVVAMVVGLDGQPLAGDLASAREATQQQLLTAVRALGGNTDGLEALASTNRDLLVQIAAYIDGLETLLATLNINTDGIEGLLSALGLKDDNVLSKLDTLRALLSGTLSTRAVTLPARQSVIRGITADANTPLGLGSHTLAPLFADCTVLNIRNLGSADVLVYNGGQDASLHGYPLPAGQSLSGDFRLSDLTVVSTAALKLALWGGKDSV